MTKPQILIVGSGALGLVAAYTLTTHGNCDVTLVVKFEYERACKEGYRFESVQFGEFDNWKPSKIVPDVESSVKNGEKYDYILVSLKNLPDGPETCEDIIRAAVAKSHGATIILFENGIDIEKPMIDNFPGHVIMSGVSLINCSNINFVVNQKTIDSIQLGLFENPTTPDGIKSEQKLDEFIELYSIPGSNKVVKDSNVRLSRWKKLVYNATMNTTTALVDLDVTRASMCGFKDSICRPLIREIYAIAKADGYTIPPELEEIMLNMSDGLFYRPSMCQDMMHNKLMEVETIVGNPLRLAEKYGVATPRLDMMYHLLKLVQFRIMEKIGLVKVEEHITGNSARDADSYCKGF